MNVLVFENLYGVFKQLVKMLKHGYLIDLERFDLDHSPFMNLDLGLMNINYLAVLLVKVILNIP